MRTIIAFIIVFVILVLVHEFGHFFFAKRSGILVREFSIGMGPKLFATRRNNTTYTLRLLPLGGYVRMAGWQDEDDEIKPGTMLTLTLNEAGVVTRINTSNKVTLQGGVPVQVDHLDLVNDLSITGYENGDDSALKTFVVDHDATIIEADGTEVVIAPSDVQFQNASVWRRLLVNFAGPMNNFILAILAFIVVGFMSGAPQMNTNQIGLVQANSPAAKAGLQPNAYIQSVNGTKITDFTSLQAAIQKHPKAPLAVVAKQSGRVQTITIKPNKAGVIGVGVHTEKSVGPVVSYGFTQTWDLTTRVLTVLKSMVTGHFSLNKLAGPVGIYKMTESSAQGGLVSLIVFLGYLSLNLGIMNLIPIPVLDGGKILLNLLEIVRRKPLSQEKEGIVTLIGAGLMVLLLIAVTINDIMRAF
ncbi:RIP metalloprotease RseP [Lacticaseibacillus baoqingensis]|uniref:Zinc metalloprotease n=1 Tax=Lacticaseibacillus baoqingensis TaxID=2486013 RepID=A0ABW4E9E2_9LACO|nr:RIP metalloprotease RseP [Lacticaseibacillus baoqingensis]